MAPLRYAEPYKGLDGITLYFREGSIERVLAKVRDGVKFTAMRNGAMELLGKLKGAKVCHDRGREGELLSCIDIDDA